MQLWHLAPDTPRTPHRVNPRESVTLGIGTWPVEPGQFVWVVFRGEHGDGTRDDGREAATWRRNAGANSYWQARLGPFARGDRVTYTVRGRSPDGNAEGPEATLRVGPKLYLAMLWHQHQPRRASLRKA